VGETNRIFIKVYAIFHHFTVAVKQNAERKSFIWKLCCSALSMMKARAVHRIDDGAIDKISVTEDIDDG
jgi:hypothetical protein